MPAKRRLKTVGAVALAVAMFGAFLYQGLAGATAASTTDPDDSASIDIIAFGHTDTADNVTFFFETQQTFDNTADFFNKTARWEFDIDGGGTLGGGDSCLDVVWDGDVSLQGQINDCFGSGSSTAFATHPAPSAGGAKRVELTFPNSTFRTDTGLSSSGSPSFSYRIVLKQTSTVLDTAPDTPGTFAFAALAPTPTPIPTPTPVPTPTPTPTPTPAGLVATDNQTLNATVSGVLSINALLASVDLGTITGGQTSAAVPVAEIQYTNTLNDGLAWTVSVASTKLQQGTGGTGKEIAYSNLSFKPGQTVTSDPGSTANPTLAPNASVPFSGAGAFSDPVGLASAPGTSQGSFHQTGSEVQLAVPLTTQAGAYTGTLQYTIIG